MGQREQRDFYPRSPCGERLFRQNYECFEWIFLSTLSLRRATSLHSINCMILTHFYPRSPCGERPSHLSKFNTSQRVFLSTLSLRRATTGFFPTLEGHKISIHALLAESDKPSVQVQHLPKSISIHALLAESDNPKIRLSLTIMDFYPRSPCGERQPTARWDNENNVISIHALLAESDVAAHTGRRKLRNFYPRSPCGERLFWGCRLFGISHFYPRSPCGERQFLGKYGSANRYISIHALLAESDRNSRRISRKELHFYPRSPCGERPIRF